MHPHVKTIIAVALGIGVVALFFWFGIPGTMDPSGGIPVGSMSQQLAEAQTKLTDVTVSADSLSEIAPGLKVSDVVIGKGDVIVEGKTAALHYVGKLAADGTQFDISLERSQPLVFVFGQGQLIAGFEQGIAGMRVGGVRHIVIPANLAYGTDGIATPDGVVIIPPNASLIFDVFLVGVDEMSVSGSVEAQ